MVNLKRELSEQGDSIEDAGWDHEILGVSRSTTLRHYLSFALLSLVYLDGTNCMIKTWRTLLWIAQRRCTIHVDECGYPIE